MSSVLARGTAIYPRRLLVEPDPSTNVQRATQAFQSIACQSEYSSFSYEELRLMDYRQDIGGPKKLRARESQSVASIVTEFERLQLLRGATIRVCVGLDSASCTGTTGAECECKSCWYLPQALLSHHSRFFKAACSCDFREKEKNRIELPSDSHAVFALFVEWMYYGYYTLPTPKFFAPAVPSEPGNMHARCAVLGDKILSNNFKNYAMRRLYEQHSDSAPIPGTLTTEDAVYVLNNTAVGSKLRQLYVDYITQHFTTPKRLAGSTEEWDGILLKYPDARSFILQSFRTPTENRKYVKSKEAYLD